MSYIKVNWRHSFPDDPTWIFSELDDNGWETRKIELFPNGEWRKADSTLPENGLTGLAEESLISIECISEQPEFTVFELSQNEFDKLWDSDGAYFGNKKDSAIPWSVTVKDLNEG